MVVIGVDLGGAAEYARDDSRLNRGRPRRLHLLRIDSAGWISLSGGLEDLDGA
jgi:hypothetical protein